MGMYTELNMAVNLKDDTPEAVLALLRYFAGEGDWGSPPPKDREHPLFECDRWTVIGRMSSYYFDWQPHTVLIKDDIGGWYFNTVFNMKNYDNEIEHFVDWIMPYVDGDYDGAFMGYSRYEECDEPTVIRFKAANIAIGGARG